MATLESLAFELERRIIVFHRDVSLPDDTQLGYVGDPNNAVNGATSGQTLLYNCPSGTFFIDKSKNPQEVQQKIQDGAGGQWTSTKSISINYITVSASSAIGGDRIVTIFNNIATYADNTTNYWGQLGVTLNAANIGEDLNVVISGPVTISGYNLINGPIFLSNNGLITQVEPIDNASIVLGYAQTNTSFIFEPQTIIER